MLLFAISAFHVEKDGFSIPLRQNTRSTLRINDLRKCNSNIKCICGDLKGVRQKYQVRLRRSCLQVFENRVVCDVPPMAVAAAFTWRTYRKFRIFFVS